MRLADKVAIVTGAGSGFGEGIATRFAAEGAKVVVNDVDTANGERVAAAIRTAGGQATFVRADVSRGDDVKALLQATLAAYGRLDIQVNNAGVSHRNQSMLTVTEDEFDRVYAINVKSLYWSAQHMAPHFRDNGGGVFINIASTGGVRPRPGLVWYNGTKGAVIVTSRAMAVELAPHRIRVNVIRSLATPPRWPRSWGKTPPRSGRSSSARFRWAASRSRATSPTPPCSWHRTKPISSPARAWRWTAGAASSGGYGGVEGRCV